MNVKQEIENLYFQYAEYIDDGQLADVAALFAQATIFGPENIKLASGTDEVLQMYSSLIKIYPETNTPRTQHLITNIRLGSVIDDQVKCRANYTVMQDLGEGNGKIETIICGQYRNIFKLVENSWVFLEHHMRPRIIGDMSAHLLIDVTNS